MFAEYFQVFLFLELGSSVCIQSYVCVGVYVCLCVCGDSFISHPCLCELCMFLYLCLFFLLCMNMLNFAYFRCILFARILCVPTSACMYLQLCICAVWIGLVYAICRLFGHNNVNIKQPHEKIFFPPKIIYVSAQKGK